MRQVKIAVEEILKYMGHITINVPDHVSDDVLEKVLEQIDKQSHSYNDVLTYLKMFPGIEVTDSSEIAYLRPDAIDAEVSYFEEVPLSRLILSR